MRDKSQETHKRWPRKFQRNSSSLFQPQLLPVSNITCGLGNLDRSFSPSLVHSVIFDTFWPARVVNKPSSTIPTTHHPSHCTTSPYTIATSFIHLKGPLAITFTRYSTSAWTSEQSPKLRMACPWCRGYSTTASCHT